MKTISLTDEEAYILGCVMAYVRYQKGDVSNLLTKIDEIQDEELGLDDYKHVDFKIDIQGGGEGFTDVIIAFNY